MRLRGLPYVALLLLTAAPAPVLAAPVDDKPAKDAPGLIVRIKSIDGLLSDFDYLAKIAGKEEEAKQARKMLENRIGKDGLAGFDTKRPMGFYGTVGPAVVDSTAVAMIPVADEKAVLSLLENLNAKAEKGDDDVYVVQPEGSRVPVYFRFANEYAYVTAQNKASIDKDKLVDPAKFFPKGETAILMVAGRIDQIPAGLKNNVLSLVEDRVKDHKVGGETAAQKELLSQLVNESVQLLASVTKEGQALELKVDLNRKTEELVVELSLTGAEDSKLAGTIKKFGELQSVFGGLKSKDSAASGLIRVSLPEKIREAAVKAVDEAINSKLEGDVAKAAAAFEPTIKAGQLDVAFDLRGPSADNLYTIVAGIKVEDGDVVEKLNRKVIANLPESEKKKIKLDVAKVGDVAIHQIDVSDSFDAEAKALFGDKPAYVAYRKDAILVALGADGLNAIKDTIGMKPAKGKAVSFEASFSRLAPLMERENPGATKIAEEVFGKLKDADRIRFTLEGGGSVKLHFSAKAELIKFGVLLDDGRFPFDSFQRPLSPRYRHGRRLAVAVAARVGFAIFEPSHKAPELLDRFLVDLSPLLRGGQFGFT
jgi:hypothetical protein